MGCSKYANHVLTTNLKVTFSRIFWMVSKTTTWWWSACANYASGIWKKWKYEDEAELLLYQLPTSPCLQSKLQSSWALILSLRENQQQQKVGKSWWCKRKLRKCHVQGDNWNICFRNHWSWWATLYVSNTAYSW